MTKLILTFATVSLLLLAGCGKSEPLELTPEQSLYNERIRKAVDAKHQRKLREYYEELMNELPR